MPMKGSGLIRGQVRVHADDETQALEPGDSLSIPAGLVHQIENVGSDNAEMTISYSTGEREYAAVESWIDARHYSHYAVHRMRLFRLPSITKSIGDLGGCGLAQSDGVCEKLSDR